MLLYSTNTWLAFTIASRFYGRQHWVYCAPEFSMISPTPLAPVQPPSSSPKNIYWELEKDVRTRDQHSSKIAQNRSGLKKGALAKEQAGVISTQEAADIAYIIDKADFADFRPLLYVIPEAAVKTRLKKVSPQNAANLFSVEYILEDLAASEFVALDLH